MGSHISFGRVDQWKLLRVKCPGCETRTRQLATYQEWYGWTIVCLACGDTWDNGELRQRPFARAWRKEAIEQAEKRLTGLRRLKRQKDRGLELREEDSNGCPP